MLKKHNKLIVFLVLAAFMFSVVGSAGAASFSDVTGTDVEANAIYKLTSLGIIDGYPDGTFGPEKTITRAEFAKIAVYSAGLQAVATGMQGTPSSFKDVKADFWANGWINVAAAQGFVKGYPDGTYKPQAQITQAEVITVLLRLVGYNDNLPGVWPANYIAKAANLGILDDVTFMANGAATRGTVAILASETLDQNAVIYEASNNLFKEDTKNGATYTLLEKNFKDALKNKDILVVGIEVNNNGKYALSYYDWSKDSSDKVIGQKRLTIAENVVVNGAANVFGLEGAIADYLVNDDNEVIYISKVPDIDAKVFGKVDSVKTTGVWNIEIDEKKYDLADPFYTSQGKVSTLRTFSDAADATYVNGLDGKKVTLFFNEDNDVVFINYTGYDGAYVVDEVGKDSIKSKNGKRFSDIDEEDDKVIVLRNGAIVELADLQENDVFYYIPNVRGFDHYIIAIANKVEGEATRISKDDLYIDGTKYKMAVADSSGKGFYAEDESGDEVDSTDLDEFLGEEIVAYMDGNGEIAFITGATSDVIGGIVGAILGAGRDSTKGANVSWVKLYTSAGEKITYDIEDDYYDDNDAGGGVIDTLLGNAAIGGAATAVNYGNLIQVSLNSAGEIDDIDNVKKATKVAAANYSASGLGDPEKDYDRIKDVNSAWKYIIDNTVIFDFDTAGDKDCDLATWKDVEDANTIAAAEIYYKDDEVKYLVIKTSGGISSSDTAGVFVDAYKTSDGDMVELYVDGKLKAYEGKGTSLYEGAIYHFKANSSDEISSITTAATAAAGNYDYVVGTVPYDGILKNSTSVVVGALADYKASPNAATYKVASGTSVYEVDKDGVVVAEFADIEEGDIVLVLEEEKTADNGIANIVVIVNKNADDYANVVASAIDLDDRVAPKVASVTATTVVFSEKVTKATAEDIANYAIDGTAVAAQTVTAASLGADGKTVTLTFSAALDTAAGKTLTITVTGVKDLAGNTIAGSNSGTHTF
jgi:hypothetical protein